MGKRIFWYYRRRDFAEAVQVIVADASDHTIQLFVGVLPDVTFRMLL